MVRIRLGKNASWIDLITVSLLNSLHENSYSRIDTVDIRPEAKAFFCGDYLNFGLDINYDLIISNPPFIYFDEFAKKGLRQLNENGYLVFLLRLNVLGGQRRKREFWDKYKPHSIYVHSKRPSFTNGGTDATEYAHFVWRNAEFTETKLYWV